MDQEDIKKNKVSDLFENNFVEYASYVIKERAIPDVLDGLKPVQRRILYSLIEMDDKRFHKVANVIGHTMKYHPHGDASIGDALVVLGNKDYFIDKQGNFGNILTGDSASAARYIECRLSPLGREVIFNREITDFVDSYDGRNKEPVLFPCKVPYVLLHGAEGIAVGLSTKIMPHNFKETLEAQIAYLKGEPFQLFPDFPQGGIMDVAEYGDGAGKIKVRAKITKKDNKTLVIQELPYGVTTESIMNSIEDAIRKNKIKASGIKDYTTERVEIEVNLQRGTLAGDVIKRLYAFTDCEVSISSNMVLIHEGKPSLFTVTQIIEILSKHLVEILRQEIGIRLHHLRDRYHYKSLVQIFIEERIYRKIESAATLEKAIEIVSKGLKPFVKDWEREVSKEDIEKLLEIPIRRIAKFDLDKNQDELKEILAKIKKEEGYLKRIKKYTIDFLKSLLEKYGDTYPRCTKIESFEGISIKDIKDKDTKVFYDLKTGYIGTDVKVGTRIDCAAFDKLLLIDRKGTYKVIPVPEKLYCGKLLYFGVMDKKQVFNLVSRDKKSRACYLKRFMIDKFIQNKDYTFLDPGHKLEDFTCREGMSFRITYEKKIKGLPDDETFRFADHPVKGANNRANKICNRKVLKVDVVRDNS